jgi:hypothetical protein
MCGGDPANYSEPLRARARAATFRCLNPRRPSGGAAPRQRMAQNSDSINEMKIYLTAVLAIAALGSATLVRAADEAKPAYPLTTCVISGEKLGAMGTPVVVTYKDTEIQLCCKGCVKTFNADADKYLQKYEQAVKDAKSAK